MCPPGNKIVIIGAKEAGTKYFGKGFSQNVVRKIRL